MENGKRNIDDLFRDSLDGMEAEFSMEAWEKLEAQLPSDTGNTGRRKFWLGILLLATGLASSGIILSMYSGRKTEAKNQPQAERQTSRPPADPVPAYPGAKDKTPAEPEGKSPGNGSLPQAAPVTAGPENPASPPGGPATPGIKEKQPGLNNPPAADPADLGRNSLNKPGGKNPAPAGQQLKNKPDQGLNTGKEETGRGAGMKATDQRGSAARDGESISRGKREMESDDAFPIPEAPDNRAAELIRTERQNPDLRASAGPVIDPKATQLPSSPASIRKPRDTRTSLAFGAGPNFSIGGNAPGYGWGLVWTNPLGRFPAWQLGVKYNRLRGYDFYSKNVSTSFGTGANILTKEARIDNLYLLQVPIVYRLNQAGGKSTGKMNWGLGLEPSWLLLARADYVETYLGTGGGYSSVTGVPIMNGLNRLNLGLTATGEISLSRKLRLELAAGIGLTDLTNNKYYKNKKFQGLNYLQAHLQYQLFKKKK